MSAMAERLLKRYYAGAIHPYRSFETLAESMLPPGGTLMDGGCGRTVPVLRKFQNRAGRLIGVELEDFSETYPGIETYKADLANLPLEDACVDLIISRAVFEHLVDPDAVYDECGRVLKPGGRLVFLAASNWDYCTIVARIVPNRFHAKVVRNVEGRKEEDSFPTQYKTNSGAAVRRLAKAAGLRVERIDYLNQYPNYFMFNGPLFFMGMCYERVTSRFEALKALRGWILVTIVKPD